jgi:phosphoribosylamine---glycine ligase
MNILLLGGGGREHAFAYKIASSPHCGNLFIAPGNPGTAKHGKNIPLLINDFSAISDFILSNKIEMLVVGPEEPLVNGIYDELKSNPAHRDLLIIGPSRDGAKLEGSKAFAKNFMKKSGIPTAAYASFSSNEINSALAYIESQKMPIVLKADGLAAGKGVVICQSADEVKIELNEMLIGSKFGTAGSTVVVEQFLSGIEMSTFILTDGKSYALLPNAKDYKRIGEGNTGLNTGGMGAISDVPFADDDLMQKIETTIIHPTLNGLQQEEIRYTGFLYFGLMIVNGNPFVIEYNCRMGDPETEVMLPRIKSDLVEWMQAAATGHLNRQKPEILPYQAATIVLASKGYPEHYEKGFVISGLERTSECLVFHAGTRLRANGDVETNGGRVLAVTAFDRSLKKAIAKAIENAELISFDGKYFRKDIGQDVIS